VGTIRLVRQGVCGFNIVSDGIHYYAIRSTSDAFDLARFRRHGYDLQFQGRTMGSVLCRILRAAPLASPVVGVPTQKASSPSDA
jgi:hypothetical protein